MAVTAQLPSPLPQCWLESTYRKAGGAGAGAGAASGAASHHGTLAPLTAHRSPLTAHRSPLTARRTPHAARRTLLTYAARRTPHAAHRTPHAAWREGIVPGVREGGDGGTAASWTGPFTLRLDPEATRRNR